MIRVWRRTRKRIMMMLDADADDGCDAFGLCFRFCFSFVRSSFCLVLAALFSSSFIHSFIPFHFSPFHSIPFYSIAVSASTSLSLCLSSSVSWCPRLSLYVFLFSHVVHTPVCLCLCVFVFCRQHGDNFLIKTLPARVAALERPEQSRRGRCYAAGADGFL